MNAARLRKNGMPAAAPLSRPRASRASEMTFLSEKMKIGLVTLLSEGSVAHDIRHWRGAKGGEIRRETIEALFDRNMVIVSLETRPKRRHVATLTQIGRLTAEGIAAIGERERSPGGSIGEAAQRLIVEMINNFEDSPTVYADEPEPAL